MTAASFLLSILCLGLALALVIALLLGRAKERDLKLANDATAELVKHHVAELGSRDLAWVKVNQARITAENERDVLLAKEAQHKPAKAEKLKPRTGTQWRRAAEEAVAQETKS